MACILLYGPSRPITSKEFLAMRRMLQCLVVIGLVLSSGVAQTNRTVTLAWQDNSNPVGTQYNVYKATGACSGSGQTFTKVNTNRISVKTFDDPIVPGNTACYYVTAVKADGSSESMPSNTAQAVAGLFGPTNLVITITVSGQ